VPQAGPAPPRLSRETRLLLVTALVSLVAIWGLARLRFPDRPISPNPLPPVLTQLAPRSPVEEIPTLIADLTARLAPLVVLVPVSDATGRPDIAPEARAGLRVGVDAAVVLLDDEVRTGEGVDIVARDQISGLTVVRTQPLAIASLPATWLPRRPDLPRYLLVAEFTGGALSFRPVFVGPLAAAPSETWYGTVWLPPARTDLMPGDLAFTHDGALAGLVVAFEGRPALVPAATLTTLADRLIDDPPAPAGYLGVHVQPMTGPLAAATGALHGVIVAHVEPDGPAAGRLMVADVIEAVDGHPVASVEAWRARAVRRPAGEPATFRVRRAGTAEEVQVIPADARPARDDPPHGLTLRTVASVGAEVVRVDPDSAAARAGLRAGDRITYFAGIRAPAAAEIVRAFDAAPADRPILVAISRAGRHHVLAMKSSR
jgi:hypothetical protein